jgi:hypothetical protein
LGHRSANQETQPVSVGARATAGSYQCAPVTSHWLQIFPPNQTVPIYLHFTSTACAKPVRLLTVNVVVPGSGG